MQGRALPRNASAIDLTQDPPPRGRWLAPSLVAETGSEPRTRRSVAAISQSPRLRATDALPTLRPPFPVPELHGVDGRASPHASARLPSLRSCRCRLPRPVRNAAKRTALSPAVRVSNASPMKSPSSFPKRERRSSPPTRSGLPRAPRISSLKWKRARSTVVIGTQLVTKGYHFPNLTLVGVVDADLGLSGGDLRAAERSFQQIQQVAGRAGRGDKPGRVLVQSAARAGCTSDMPHSCPGTDRASMPRKLKRGATLPCLRSAGWPRSSSPAESSSDAESVARRLGQAAPSVEGMAVFGPAPAPLAMLRGRHRQRLLVHAARSLDVQDVIRDWLAGSRLEPQGPGQRRRRPVLASSSI